MKSRNRQILKYLDAEFGVLGGEAYEVNGSLWLDIEDEKAADNVFRYLSFECPMSLPMNFFKIQRKSTVSGVARHPI